MYGAVEVQASSSSIYCSFSGQIVSSRRPPALRQIWLPRCRLSLASIKSGYSSAAVEESQPSVLSNCTSSVGSPSAALQLPHWNLTQRHLVLLNVVACAVTSLSPYLSFSFHVALHSMFRCSLFFQAPFLDKGMEWSCYWPNFMLLLSF